MPKAIAVIPTDLKYNRLGLPAHLDDRIAGRSVLEHTLSRIAQVPQIEHIVLTHPADQDPTQIVDLNQFDKPVHPFADEHNLRDAYTPMRIAAAKWALTAWRGGLGGALCHDLILPARPIAQAMQQWEADCVLLVGADWLFVDPDLCSRVLELNLQHPEQMKLTFSQAPPGLAGIAAARTLIEQMAEKPFTTFGRMLAYDPARPQGDSIGRDVCVQVPAAVRSCARRFIYDTPRTRTMLHMIADKLGDTAPVADSTAVTAAFADASNNGHADQALRDFAALPQQITVELNATRLATGPLVAQHHVSLDRQPMPLDTAMNIVRQLGETQDVALTLGGAGDPLLYEGWQQVVTTAHEAGVFGIAIETDLLSNDAQLVEDLIDLPVDVVSVRLNADSAAMYHKLMGVDQFALVTGTMERLINTRNRRSHESADALAQPGLPWIVPRFIKTAENLSEMESFFDRWMHFVQHAVIDSPSTGYRTDGQPLMPDQSLMQMAPPRREACRQLHRRMTVLCDGRIAQCDQDWLGQSDIPGPSQPLLRDAWQTLQTLRQAHRNQQWNEHPLCANCTVWHRP